MTFMPTLRSPAGYLAAPVRAREQFHRRVILLGIAALIILSTSPVIGHHLGHQASSFLIDRDHVLNLCLVALHELLAPMHDAFHLLLFAGIAYAVYDRGRAFFRLRGTLGLLDDRGIDRGDIASIAAARARVGERFIRIVPGLPTPAFTAGWFRPQIYLAASLSSVLSVEQLAAVISHEDAHRRRRDPLRLSMLRLLACTLFYLPALRRLADDVADEAEIAADDDAAARSADPLVLASAIVELASYPASLHPGMVGFQRPEILERRVRRLAGEDAVVGTHVTRRSLSGAAILLVAVWTSGLIMAHPMPAEAAGVSSNSSADTYHCTHHHRWPLAHLFCLGFGNSAGADESSASAATHHMGSARHCPHGIGAVP